MPKQTCSLVKGCKGYAYARFSMPELDQRAYPPETPCRQHTAVLISHLVGLTRKIEIEGV